MPFTTLFTDFVEARSRTYTEGLVYAKDPELKARLPLLRDAATTILVNIALTTKGNVAMSPRIEALTRDYRLTQDKVAYFIDSRIEKKDGNRLPVATLRGALKEWHRTGTETPLDINMVIDRLMRDPYGYPFNSARNLGFGLAIRDAFALDDSGVADEAPLDAEQEFIICFARCHIATKDELDFVPVRDVTTWAAHNSMRLQNSRKMLDLVRLKFERLGVYVKGKRIPKRGGRSGSETRDCFFRMKRVMWRDDGVAPIENKDANSSFGTEPDEDAEDAAKDDAKDEVASELSFEA